MLKQVWVFILLFFSLFLMGVSNNVQANALGISANGDRLMESIRYEVPAGTNKVDKTQSPSIVENKIVNSTTSIKSALPTTDAIILSKLEDEVNVGESDVIGALITDDKIKDKTIIWTSTDDNIATVDDAGKVNAISPGIVKITAATIDGNNSTSCNVTVISKVVNVISVSLNETQEDLTVGQVDTLTTTVSPDNATNKNIIWDSSDSDIATVDDMGDVTAVSAGTAVITAVTEDGFLTATCIVDITDELAIPIPKTPLVFAIDIGHNAKYDSGAVGIRSEDVCTKEVGTKVIDKLTALGYTVINCAPVNATSTTNALKQRVDKANAAHADYYVSIHFNIANGKAKGSEIYMGSNRIKTKAQAVLNNLKDLGYSDRGLHDNSRGLYVLKNTKMPAMLVECSFLDSVEDMNRYNPDDIAEAIVEGLIADN